MVSALEGLYCTPHCFEVLCGLLSYGERKYPQTSLRFSWYWTHWENSISGVEQMTVNIVHVTTILLVIVYHDLWPLTFQKLRWEAGPSTEGAGDSEEHSSQSVHGLPAHLHTQRVHCEWLCSFVDCSYVSIMGAGSVGVLCTNNTSPHCSYVSIMGAGSVGALCTNNASPHCSYMSIMGAESVGALCTNI